jgi:hypothetical protein
MKDLAWGDLKTHLTPSSNKIKIAHYQRQGVDLDHKHMEHSDVGYSPSDIGPAG